MGKGAPLEPKVGIEQSAHDSLDFFAPEHACLLNILLDVHGRYAYGPGKVRRWCFVGDMPLQQGELAEMGGDEGDDSYRGLTRLQELA